VITYNALKKAAIITAFDPFEFKGGIETYTLQLRDLLEDRDVRTDIYHTGMVREDHGLHNDYLGRLYVTGRKVLENREDYDLVIANAFYGLGFFPPGERTFNIFHLTHMGFAEQIKEIVPKDQYLEWKVLWGGLCESVSGFHRVRIAVSESVRDELSTYYGFDEVTVIRNCVDTDAFVRADKIGARRRWGIPEHAFVGLYVGRWDILKRCDILEEVMRATPDVYWLVALGTGSERNAVGQMRHGKIIEQVEHRYMNTVYSAADFMLFPSSYEGYGYAVTEAMACELPVIASNVGIVKTIYKAEPFQRLLLPDFSAGLKNIVVSALENIECVRSRRDWISKVEKEGRRLMEREFGTEEWKTRMLGVLGV
jgi:glycosyltransferase involved in cell wall biosynthesis